MESARREASGMDAARGVKGHGWPLYAGPRSAAGMREVERSEPGTPSPDAGAKRFWLLFRRLEKVTRPAGRNQCLGPLGKRTRWRRQNFASKKQWATGFTALTAANAN